MAEVSEALPGSSSPRYVVNREDGGKQKAGEKNSPFIWMIEGFSTLLTRGAAKYHSGNFTVGGFTWKLQLDPNSSEENGEKSVRFNLSYESSTASPVVKAAYILFMYDQLFGQHVQKEGEDYFHSTSPSGLSSCKVLLEKFKDPKSGLIVNDCCVFGAKIREATACELKLGFSERWSVNKEIAPVVEHSWTIKDFLNLKLFQTSEFFHAGNYIWRVELYPNDNGYLGIFLRLQNPPPSSQTRVSVEFSLSVLNQIHGTEKKISGHHQFSCERTGRGCKKFLKRKDVEDPSKGFVGNGTCIVKASVTLLGVVTTAAVV